MSYIFGPVPYFRALMRAEYTQNLQSRHGEYLPVVIEGVRCQRGISLYFQAWMQTGPERGAMFLAPIQAFVTKPCVDEGATHVQPWDTFSPHFGVSILELHQRGRVEVIRGAFARAKARYMMTLDFTGNDLSDDLEQHKLLHIVVCDSGYIGAYPNNRLLWNDPAFIEGGLPNEPPRFKALEPTFSAE